MLAQRSWKPSASLVRHIAFFSFCLFTLRCLRTVCAKQQTRSWEQKHSHTLFLSLSLSLCSTLTVVSSLQGKHQDITLQPSLFTITQSRTVSSAIDITRTIAEFSRDLSLVFVVRVGQDNTVVEQERVLGAIADTFGQDLWQNNGEGCPLLTNGQNPDLTQSNGSTRQSTSRIEYTGRIPCKAEIHYISIPGSPKKAVVSVHNVHTLTENLLTQYTHDSNDLSATLDALYSARPSFVSPIDGLQVMKDVYHLVDLANQHNEDEAAGLATGSTSLTSTDPSALILDRDQMCWRSVRHAVQVIEEAVKRYGYVLANTDIFARRLYHQWRLSCADTTVSLTNTHSVDVIYLDLKVSRCHLTEERTVPLFCTCLSPYSTDCMDQDPNQPRLRSIPRNK